MNMNRIYGLGILSLTAFLFAGCVEKEAGHDFENKVFISETSSFARKMNVKTDEKQDELSADISVGMADVENKSIEVTFTVAPELLDKYRQAYYDGTAQLLPETNYVLPEGMKAVIEKGKVTSDAITFNFKGLLAITANSDKSYVLPVRISDASGLGVLNSASTVYFVIREASLINVVGDLSDNCAWPEFGTFEKVHNMEQFTLEALVNGASFNNTSSIATIMGIEDKFLIRVGDVTIPKNQIQVATARADTVNNTTHRQSVSNADMKLKTDRWYHIAVSFNKGIVNVYIDGKLRGTGDFTTNEVDLTEVDFMIPHSDEADNKPRCFWIGYSYNDERSFMGTMSEIRIWDRALSAEEINAENHFYKVINPQSHDDLVAYWKLDGTLKDYSKYGHDLQSKTSLVWREVTLPEKK